MLLERLLRRNTERALLLHELWFKEKLEVQPSWTFIDIGAHIGQWAMCMANKEDPYLLVRSAPLRVKNRNTKNLRNPPYCCFWCNDEAPREEGGKLNVSLLGYLYHLKKWTRMVACGCGFRDKLTLCAWLLLDTIPRIVMPPSPQKEPFRLQKDRLMSKVMISVNGCVFRCLDTESVSILSPYSEDWMWDYLNLNPGDVFVDVGAHIGKYTIPAAKIVGMGGLVIAVEPHPENYRVLLDNIKLNALRNVIALNLAAWSTSGEVKLYIGDRSGWHSTKRNYGKGFITVQGRALDDLFDELKVKRIDFIKIDVEYAESEVLRGLESTISKYGPDMIVESWYPWEIDRLNKYGYTVAKIAPGYYYLSRNVKTQSNPRSGKRFFAYKYL